MRNFGHLAITAALVFTISAIPCWADTATTDKPKHPILGHMFVWLVRANYKPKEVTPLQQDAQNRLDQCSDYRFSIDRAHSLGMEPVRGRITEIRLPDWQKSKFLFFVIPISLVYLPTSFFLQPVQDDSCTKHGLVMAVAKEGAVMSAVYLDAKNFGKLQTADDGSPKVTFGQYARVDIIDRCGESCLNKAMQCSPILATAPVAIHAAVGSYLTCILSSKDCGGCLLDGLTQAVVDYALQARTEKIPATAGSSNDNKGVSE